ncbi:MAG: hypothetical protein Q4D90_06435 [bacterium]|nr:hypothetical protein [bacterium]
MRETKKAKRNKTEAKSQEPAILAASEDSFQAASTSDCTGLIPALPTSEAELESYEEMYPFLPRSQYTP